LAGISAAKPLCATPNAIDAVRKPINFARICAPRFENQNYRNGHPTLGEKAPSGKNTIREFPQKSPVIARIL
jgi:hypothetical protein